MSDMDWKAAMSSEIFREYAKNEILKINKEKIKFAEKDESEDLKILEEFRKFEHEIKSSPKKLAIFKTLQHKFATDSDYASKTKASFVEAVMMLDLS